MTSQKVRKLEEELIRKLFRLDIRYADMQGSLDILASRFGQRHLPKRCKRAILFTTGGMLGKFYIGRKDLERHQKQCY